MPWGSSLRVYLFAEWLFDKGLFDEWLSPKSPFRRIT
jgi:hypothetical protein